MLLIVVAAAIVYSNIYQVPFVFDDFSSIVENPDIRNLSNYTSLKSLLMSRKIVWFTFAFNYAIGVLDPFGYHLVNVVIHILAGLVAYGLALVLLRKLSSFSDPVISYLGLFSGLLFVTHPLQTQAVTYTCQRYTSMAALFYMAAVLIYIHARVRTENAGKKEGKSSFTGRSILYLLSFLCGIIALLSKQNAFTLPGILLLTELLLFDNSWKAWKRKLPWYALFSITWILITLFSIGFFTSSFEGGNLLEDVSKISRITKDVNRWNYLFTQFNVISIYIRLLFLPARQNLDYLYQFKTGFFDGLTPVGFLFS